MAKKRLKKKATKKAPATKAARKAKARALGRNAKRSARSAKDSSTKKASAKKNARKSKAKAPSTGAKRSAHGAPAKKRTTRRRPVSAPVPDKGQTIEAPASKETSGAATPETITDVRASETITQKVSNALTAAVEKISDVISGGEKGASGDEGESGPPPGQQ
jgi:hypothetical protein